MKECITTSCFNGAGCLVVLKSIVFLCVLPWKQSRLLNGRAQLFFFLCAGLCSACIMFAFVSVDVGKETAFDKAKEN